MSLFASPRTLHSWNVFLIRLTVCQTRAQQAALADEIHAQRATSQSFPVLIAISIYERYLAPGRKFIERSKDRTAALFHRLPRKIKTVPLIEALIGTNGSDLLEAIFDVDVDEAHLEPLFDPGEDDFFDRAQILTQQSAGVQSDPSRVGRSRSRSNAPSVSIVPVDNTGTAAKDQQPASALRTPNPDALSVPPPLSPPPTRGRGGGGSAGAAAASAGVPRSPAVAIAGGSNGGTAPAGGGAADQNRLRKRSQTPATRPQSTGHMALMSYDEETQAGFQSPLARLFSSAVRRPPRPIDYAPSQVPTEEALIGIRRLEVMVEGLKEDKGTVSKIRSDMKELQVRVCCFFYSPNGNGCEMKH